MRAFRIVVFAPPKTGEIEREMCLQGAIKCGRSFPQVADDGWRVAGSGWWVTGEGDGWRVTGDGWLVTGGKEILQLKNENKRSKVADTFF